MTTPAAVPPFGVAMNLLNYSGRAMLPMIRQSEAAECGLACLAMVASYHGHPTTLGMLRRRLPVSLTGLSLADLIDMADEIGLAARPLRAAMDEIASIRLPAVLPWDLTPDRKRGVAGQSGSVSVVLGGASIIKTQKKQNKQN